jgi:hypothetical protein
MNTRTEVEQYFKGAEYPATKRELTVLARERNDAPEDFIRTLLGMSNLTFSGSEEVVEALQRLRDPNWMMRD